MDSDDSQDGSRKARSSSSDSNSSRSPRQRSSSSDGSDKNKRRNRDYGPRSPSSPHGLESPDNAISNLSTQDSEMNSPRNVRPMNSGTGPKTPDSNGSRDASLASRSPSRGPKTPASPSSPAPDSLKGPHSPQSGKSSCNSPANHSRDNWSSRSNSRSHKTRSGSVNSDGSRSRSVRPRSPGSVKSQDRSTSSSSRSSRESSPPKRRQPPKDPATEEVSDGEMDSDQGGTDRRGPRSPSEEKKDSQTDLNISHEDLSDVSDLDSVDPTYDDGKSKKSPSDNAKTEEVNKEALEKSEVKVNGNLNSHHHHELTSPPLTNGSLVDPQKFDKLPLEKTSRTEDVEEQLDFEAEEGECLEPPEQPQNNGEREKDAKGNETKIEGAAKSDSELEEGEVSDEGDRRPEEVEPRPVCRFYSRGQCTWGINCRFLHPGVTDKGNYTMFDMVRAMPGVGGPMMHGRPPPHIPHPMYREALPMAPPAPTESAWERGLRTAKEMLRLASKRREQEGAEFEEKRLHLSAAATAGVIAPEADPDALYVSTAAVGASPPQRAASPAAGAAPYSQHYRDVDYYGRQAYEERYAAMRGGRPREMAVHRSQVYYEDRERFDDRLRYDDRQRYEDRVRYEEKVSPTDEQAGGHHAVKRRARTTREVIVQRAPSAERERERVPPTSGRGDEWADPWMRGGGANAAGRKRHKRSASSHTSYSTSSSRSSHSSRGRTTKKRRSVSKPRRPALSPSVIVRERRAAVARATAMNPPAPSPHRRRAPSPAAERALAATNPPPPAAASTRRKTSEAYGRTKPSKPTQRTKKRYSRSSSSGSDSSSSSSESDSDSHSSSTSRSSSEERRRGGNSKATANRRAAPISIAAAAVRVPAKAFSAATQGKKEISDMKDLSGKKRSASSPVNNAVPAKKPVSRREELLKQLKAVEDAIARKRSKI